MLVDVDVTFQNLICDLRQKIHRRKVCPCKNIENIPSYVSACHNVYGHFASRHTVYEAPAVCLFITQYKNLFGVIHSRP